MKQGYTEKEYAEVSKYLTKYAHVLSVTGGDKHGAKIQQLRDLASKAQALSNAPAEGGS